MVLRREVFTFRHYSFYVFMDIYDRLVQAKKGKIVFW